MPRSLHLKKKVVLLIFLPTLAKLSVPISESWLRVLNEKLSSSQCGCVGEKEKALVVAGQFIFITHPPSINDRGTSVIANKPVLATHQSSLHYANKTELPLSRGNCLAAT